MSRSDSSRPEFRAPLAWLLVLSTLLAVGCGGDDGPSAPDPDPPVVQVLPADPDGMLLPGDDSDPAVAATVWLAPTPVGPDAVEGHWLTTRLVAGIASDATVGEVNDALVAADAAIVSMVAGSPLVVLVVDAMADPDAARQRAADLVASGAFAYARPGSTAPGRAILKKELARDQPADGASTWFTHLESSRVPATWNLRAAATHTTTLVIPHAYGEGLTFDEVANFTLDEDDGGTVPAEDFAFLFGDANSGFHTAGVAAADWDHDATTSPHTGVDAAAADLTTVIGVGTYGLEEIEKIAVTALSLTAAPRQVLLVAETFEDPLLRRIDKAWAALHWRHALDAFLDATPGAVAPVTIAAGGPEDTAAAVATQGNLVAFAAIDSDPDEQQAFFDAYADWTLANPALLQPVPHVLTVGSSNANGALSSFSRAAANVRIVGEGVWGPCVVPGACSTPTVQRSTDGAAAAQVAGLASYLWHMDDGLTPENVLLRLQHAYSTSARSGVLDAWTALLSLDSVIDPQFAPMRLALLDVASGPGVWGQDGRFDHRDIEVLLDAFDAFPGNYRDWSRFDLNGDGVTGTGTARMDLDADTLPAFESVTQSILGSSAAFDENAVSDRDVLCYYAYSDLYTGDTGTRDLLLVDCGGSSGSVQISGTPFREARVSVTSFVPSDYDIQEFPGAGSASFTPAADESYDVNGNRARATASALSNSTIGVDGIFASGDQSVFFDAALTNLGIQRADWRLETFARTLLDAELDVVGGTVPFTLEITYDVDVVGTSYDVLVSIFVDGDETGDVGSVFVEGPGSDTLQISGVLEPDDYWIAVEIRLDAGFREALIDSAEVNCTWSLAFDLTP